VADQLTEAIIAAAIEVHKTLGSGLLEIIYEEALCHEFGLVGLAFQRQIAVDVIYKGHVIQGQRLDLLVENEVVVEIKSLRTLREVATSQLLSYLKASNLKRGLLINFGKKQLTSGVKRISLCSLWQLF
jgi:GxxExxY protein